MKTWVRKTLSVGVLAAGALLFAPGAANADTRQITGGNVGALNGTQIAVPVNVPVNIVGNSLGLLGVADARGAGVNNVTESGGHGDRGRGPTQVSGGNVGLLNGTQAYLPVTVPLNVVGNAAAVGGFADAQGFGANHVTESGSRAEHRRDDGPTQVSGPNFGVGNGTQIYAPVDIPINACGNSLAILGFSQADAACANDVSGNRGGRGLWNESGRGGRGGGQVSGPNFGVANGSQLYAPISLPLNLAGNSAALLGSSSSRAVAVNESARGGDDVRQASGGNFGLLNGTQVGAPINVPINACGNALGVLGVARSNAACVNEVGARRVRGNDWAGDHGHSRPRHFHGDDGWDEFDGDVDDLDDGDDLGDFDDDRDDYKPGRGVKDDGYGTKNVDDLADVDDTDDLADVDDADDLADVDDGEPDANVKPAANDGYTKPAANDGYTKPIATGSKTKAKGGRAATESAPVSTATETVGGLGALGLLNNLR